MKNINQNTQTDRHKKISTIYLLVLYITLSVISVFIHNIIVDQPFHQQRVELHRQVIAGEAPAPIQYRIFVYYIAEGMIRAGIDFSAAYWLIRFSFLFLSAIMLHLYMRKWLADAACLSGVLFMFAVMPLTYWGYFMQPTDPVNLMFFIAAFWLIRERKDAYLAPLLFAASFNREAPVILPLVFLLYRYDELSFGELSGKTALYCLLTFGVYFGLTKIIGVRGAYEEIFMLARNLSDYRSLLYPALFFGVFAIVSWRGFFRQPKFLRRSAMMIPFFLVIHYAITIPRETRLFLPLLPLVIPMGLINLFGRNDGSSDEEKTAPHTSRDCERTAPLPSAGVSKLIAHVGGPVVAYIVLFILFLGIFRLYYLYMEKAHMKNFYSNREAALLTKEGDDLIKRNDYAGAAKVYELALAKDPQNEAANLTLGIIFAYHIKDPAKALFYFNRTLQINPRTPQAEKILSEITRLKESRNTK